MSDELQARGGETVLKRRGFFAAAAALVAAVVAKVTEQPLRAGTDGDVVLGASNVATQNTSIISSAFYGLIATGGGVGLAGYHDNGGASSGAGVYGQSFNSYGSGVFGLNLTPPPSSDRSVGVLGRSAYGIGVLAHSDDGTAGVLGEIGFGTQPAVAVYGANSSNYRGTVPGGGGFGVYGISARGHGLVGAAATAGAAALVGATNGVAGAYAGTFYGPVVVSGDLAVLGAKSAAVPHPDGSHRRLYCVESPESWFEDFGKGRLASGCASVTIDPDFAAVADLTDYHVFLTPYSDDHDGLHVADRTARGFTVKARAGVASGEFSWRIVAKRRDIAALRFETVTVPPEPALPEIPPTPVAPVPRAVGRSQ